MELGIQSRIRFGPFEADLETGELRKDGLKLALQVQPFQVLAILLKNSGGLVTREQLQSHVWPKDTFVDFDHALNTAITKIRLALGDDAEHPKYIETLPRRGYRFIGAVEKIPAEQTDLRPSVKKRKRLLIGAGSLAAALILVSAIALWRGYQNDSTLSRSIEVAPLVSLPGAQAFPAISPDGNQVAFAQFDRRHEIFNGRDGAIYTALIGGDKPLQLTAKSGACCPTWSPDNRQIAFLRSANAEITINVVPALGGVADPQLQLQFGQQSLEPPRLPTGFHPHPYLYSSHGKLAIKLLRLLAMLQSSFSELTSVGVYKSNLLESRVIIATYNDHVRLLSPGPWLVSATKAYSGVGADIVMESIWRCFTS